MVRVAGVVLLPATAPRGRGRPSWTSRRPELAVRYAYNPGDALRRDGRLRRVPSNFRAMLAGEGVRHAISATARGAEFQISSPAWTNASQRALAIRPAGITGASYGGYLKAGRREDRPFKAAVMVSVSRITLEPLFLPRLLMLSSNGRAFAGAYFARASTVRHHTSRQPHDAEHDDPGDGDRCTPLGQAQNCMRRCRNAASSRIWSSIRAKAMVCASAIISSTHGAHDRVFDRYLRAPR